MWDVDSLDWKSKNEASILTEIQRQVRNGSIILMHDIHAETVNAFTKDYRLSKRARISLCHSS